MEQTALRQIKCCHIRDPHTRTGRHGGLNLWGSGTESDNETCSTFGFQVHLSCRSQQERAPPHVGILFVGILFFVEYRHELADIFGCLKTNTSDIFSEHLGRNYVAWKEHWG